MALTDRQAFVLTNLDRVTSDGARCDARYELYGVNVSQRVRALVAQGIVEARSHGTLSKCAGRPSLAQGSGAAAVAEQMRELLLAKPAEQKRLSRRLVDSPEKQ